MRKEDNSNNTYCCERKKKPGGKFRKFNKCKF